MDTEPLYEHDKFTASDLLALTNNLVTLDNESLTQSVAIALKHISTPVFVFRGQPDDNSRSE